MDPQPHGAEPADGPPADYGETAGLVYEATEPAYTPVYQPQAYPPGEYGPQEYGAPQAEPPEDDADGESATGGLSIFGSTTASGAPGDEEPPGNPPAPYQYPDPARQPTAELSPAVPDPAGAGQGQPASSPADADGDADGGAGGRKRPSLGIGIPKLAQAITGGGADQPQIAVRDLPPDVQIRFWRVRVTIMVAVGLLSFLLTRNWVIAITLAILAGIGDALYRARNAARYQNGASSPEGLSDPGARRRTRRQLARMRRAGYFALDARPIPNSREYIDHLVIGPTGVYAIDSEKWDAKLPIRTWNGKKLYHGPESQKARLEHAVWEASQASEILSGALGTDITVRPALAIYGPKIPWDIATIRNVDVFTGPALRKYLKRRGRMHGETPRLTREQVRSIYDTATRMLPDVAPSQTATPVG